MAVNSVISLPEGLGIEFENFLNGRKGKKLSWTCVGAGCGSAEFEVEHRDLPLLMTEFGAYLTDIAINSIREFDDEE